MVLPTIISAYCRQISGDKFKLITGSSGDSGFSWLLGLDTDSVAKYCKNNKYSSKTSEKTKNSNSLFSHLTIVKRLYSYSLTKRVLLSNVPKQKSISKIAINARFVRARATAIKPELNLMRKNASKMVSLLILYTACVTLFPKPELDKTTLHVLSITLFIYLFLIATWAISRGPEFNKKIKQKSV